MNWWALIKLIASIIGQLPFDSESQVSDSEIEVSVRNELASMDGDSSAAGLADIDFEKLISLLVGVVKAVQEIVKMFQPKDPDASI